jgi:hypothetical protein
MNRDIAKFPDDEHGDALWNMAKQGDELGKERDIEFTVAFQAEEEALKFGEVLLFNRQQVLLYDTDNSDYPYNIVVTVAMIPSYRKILDYEKLLDEHASKFNGLNDGWGCGEQG